MRNRNRTSRTSKILEFRENRDIISIIDISRNLSDQEALDLANRQGRVIITFDTDFGKLIFKEKLKVKDIILLRFIPKTPQQVVKTIEYLIATGISIENWPPSPI